MSTKIVTFRCPEELLEQADSMAGHFKRTRNSVLLAAVRLFARQLREQHGGVMSAPMQADMLNRETMFPNPESRGGRPRKQKP
ncbi:MAG: hypothetical protein IKW48_04200 [Akkermansia sp.]|nr:hypothetical protein [Akkermansia sp.]